MGSEMCIRDRLCNTNSSDAAGAEKYIVANMESSDGVEASKLSFKNTCSDIWHHDGRVNYRRPSQLESVTANLEGMFQVESPQQSSH